jgi:NADPH:quinone reductase-like Zn-dependent oxidoreductase
MHIIPMMFRRAPAIAETDFSGTILAVGDEVPSSPPGTDATSNNQVQSFPVGSKVFGSIPVPAHLKGSGCLAGYVAVEMNDVARIPDAVSMEEASCLAVSGITAIDVVDLAELKPGYRVLINAPCGGVGTIATQLVRHAIGGDGFIVGICSDQSADLAKSIGCDTTMNYRSATEESTFINQLVSMCAKDGLFDAIVDCHGSQELWHEVEKLLKVGSNRHYATVGPKFPSMSYVGMATILWQMLANMATPAWAGGVARSYKQAASFINVEKLERVRALAEQGIIRPHVGSKFAFKDTSKARLRLIGSIRYANSCF